MADPSIAFETPKNNTSVPKIHGQARVIFFTTGVEYDHLNGPVATLTVPAGPSPIPAPSPSWPEDLTKREKDTISQTDFKYKHTRFYNPPAAFNCPNELVLTVVIEHPEQGNHTGSIRFTLTEKLI